MIEQKMIDIKMAVDKAANYLVKFFPNAIDIQLEEIEMDKTEQHWLITLSFIEKKNVGDHISIIPSSRKNYKVFKLDSTTGKVISMKIREIASEHVY
jgi:hypothetical protein